MSEHPVRLVIGDELSRKRLTVFFRVILVIPHFLWMAIWGIGAFFAALANWVATLVTGRPPEALHRFLGLYVKYVTQVYAYFLLAADPYPPFDGRSGYPIDVTIAAPEAQNRATVAFRLILVIPALLLAAALFGAPNTSYRSNNSTQLYGYTLGLAHAAAFLGWFACLAVKRMPRGLRDCVAWGIGLAAQLWAYLFVLTDRYPDTDPAVVMGDLPAQEHPVRLEQRGDLRRSRLTVFFRLLLAFPHFFWLVLWGVLALLAAIASWFATLVRGRTPAALHRFLAAYVRYYMHVYAFVGLLGNPFPGFVGARDSYPVEVLIEEPAAQNRWTVAFRLILIVPAWIVASAYGSLLWTAAFLGWFAALATGAMPRRLENAGLQALRYLAQSSAYLFLVTGAYPYSGPSRVAGAASAGAPAVAGLPSA